MKGKFLSTSNNERNGGKMTLSQLPYHARFASLASLVALTVLLSAAGSSGATPVLAATGRSPSTRSLGDWSQFRFGPQHHGLNPFETILSPSTVGGLEERWSTGTGESIASSPAVVNGVLYVGSLDIEGKVYALDITTGALLWAAPTGLTGGVPSLTGRG
jgi:glucose dehydrogenase